MRMQFRGLWRDANFLKLWSSQAISSFGSQMTFLALPLTAVLVLGAAPSQMGLLMAIEATPSLLIGLFVGVWVEHTVHVLDEDYWTEILGENIQHTVEQKPKASQRTLLKSTVKFPIPIQAKHKGLVFQAELLDLGGKVRFQGVIYETPTAAAKVVTTDWKAVNGWDFWKYQSSETGKIMKIGTLK